VVEAVALVVSALPAEQRKAGLEALLSPIVVALQACLQQPPPANGHVADGHAAHSNIPVNGIDHATPLVDRMTIVFRCAPKSPHDFNLWTKSGKNPGPSQPVCSNAFATNASWR
jgi:hypothetical protein